MHSFLNVADKSPAQVCDQEIAAIVAYTDLSCGKNALSL